MTMLKKMSSQTWAALILVLAGALYIALLPRFETGIYNDDAAYVLAARSLWNGHYSFLAFPGQPSADFPFPGVPLVLTPFVQFLGKSFHILEFLSCVMTVVAALLFWSLARRWLPPVAALAALAAFVFNPAVAHMSGILLSTPFFIVGALGSAVLFERLLRVPSRAVAWSLGLVLGWTALVRPEGVLFLVAVCVALSIKGDVHDMVRVFCAGFPAWFLFMCRSLSHHGIVNVEYAGDLSALAAFWPSHGVLLLRRICFVAAGLFARTAVSFPNNLLMMQGQSIFIAGIGFGVTCAGFIRVWRRQTIPHPILWMVALSHVMAFSVYVFWFVSVVRYLIPLLPFTFIFFIHGLYEIVPAGPGRRWVFTLIGAVMMCSYSFENSFALYESLVFNSPDHSAPHRSLQWLEQFTSKKDLILSPITSLIYLWSDRQGISLTFSKDEDEFFYTLGHRGITYIVDRSVRIVAMPVPNALDPNREWWQIRRWIALHPERFPLVYECPAEKVRIYRVAQNPEFAAAYESYMAARKDFLDEQWDNGFVQLAKCHRQDKTLAPAYNAEGATLLFLKKDFKRASGALLAAIGLRPNYTTALFNMSRFYMKTGKPLLALKYLQRAVDASRAGGTEDQFREVLRESHIEWDVDLPENPSELISQEESFTHGFSTVTE